MKRALAFTALLVFFTASSYSATNAMGIESVGMTVSDLDRAVEFYTKVLCFEKLSEREVAGESYEHLEGVFGMRARIALLRLGEETLEVTEYLAPKGRPIPPDFRSNDRSFQHVAIIVSDMQKAYAVLRAHKVTHASSGPQRLPDWNVDAGGIEAFYFRDPDNHTLEILHFPAGKGSVKWRKKDRLFLGIDHTAIVISHTEVSLGFYRDSLGMRIAGRSENYGVEQEHLNNVFGARLRITALRTESGPGIELLEYLTPRDGRPYPAGEQANDLIHWQTRIATSSVSNLAEKLRSDHADFLSSAVIETTEAEDGFHKSFIVRDPDGHALQFVERKQTNNSDFNQENNSHEEHHSICVYRHPARVSHERHFRLRFRRGRSYLFSVSRPQSQHGDRNSRL